MEHFYTIQGEGFFTGNSCYFIRFGGCDVGCVWCDVKESWDPKNHPNYTINQLLEIVIESKAHRVVLTGGEPAMYDLSELINLFHQNKILVHIETSGAYEIKGNYDWVCLSPKKFKFPLNSELSKANEFKAVVFHKNDIEWANTFINELSPSCQLYLQPEWSKKDVVTPLIIDYVKENPQWKISLQTHKFVGIP